MLRGGEGGGAMRSLPDALDFGKRHAFHIKTLSFDEGWDRLQRHFDQAFQRRIDLPQIRFFREELFWNERFLVGKFFSI
jgi:hypothetical protein